MVGTEGERVGGERLAIVVALAVAALATVSWLVLPATLGWAHGARPSLRMKHETSSLLAVGPRKHFVRVVHEPPVAVGVALVWSAVEAAALLEVLQLCSADCFLHQNSSGRSLSMVAPPLRRNSMHDSPVVLSIAVAARFQVAAV